MGVRGAAAAALVAVLIASCGAGSDEDGTVRPSGPLGPYIEAFCQAARSCCGQSPFGDQELGDCEAELERQTGLEELIAFGNIIVDGAGLEACVAAFRRAATECVVGDELRSSCGAPILRGTLGEGAACHSSIECWNGQGDWACLRQFSSSDPIGVCRRIARGSGGDACRLTCDDTPCLSNITTSEADPVLVICAPSDGLHCAANVCAPIIAPGGVCSDDVSCGAEGFCDGVCTRRKSENEACTYSSECAGPLSCVEGRCADLPIATEKLCSGDLN